MSSQISRGRPNGLETQMAGKYLIDLTDARFCSADNQEVIDFVRRVNPFAHRDGGAMGGHDHKSREDR